MIEHRRRRVALTWAFAVFVFLPSQRSLAADWDAVETERATDLLADSLSRLEAGVTASDSAVIEPDQSGAARTILRGAIADCDELAATLREGATREETQAVYRRLQAHRQALVSLGMSRNSQIFPPRELDAAQALWEELAATYRKR